MNITTRLAFFALLTVGCAKEKPAEAPTPVATRIDSVGLELDLLPAWMPGGPSTPGPNEAYYYRGHSPVAPSALIYIVNTDMDLSRADDDRLLFLSKTVGAQVVRAGGTCQVAPLGGRKVGRCQVDSMPLAKASYTVPDGMRTFNLLFQWRGDGPSFAGEADTIVASLRAAK
jgi:hypothetical protein